MNLQAWMLTAVLLAHAAPAFADNMDLNPPPLNPHPTEAMHVSVTFDKPEDAKRYTVSMVALYENKERDCGYFDPLKGGIFRYPQAVFDIPNTSHDPVQAQFNLYMDRYYRSTCNWEVSSSRLQIHDVYTGQVALAHRDTPFKLIPGMEYKEICLFREDEFPQICYGKRPELILPYKRFVVITVRVSKDSAPLRPVAPGDYSHLTKIMNFTEVPNSPRQDARD